MKTSTVASRIEQSGLKSDSLARVSAEVAHRWLLLSLWGLATILGAVQAWETRYAMNADGVSYLDMSDGFFKGDWSSAINGYWSPLYPFLLSAASAIFNPSPYWEFPLVHLINFVIYLGALGCFHFLLREIVLQQQKRVDGFITWPAWAWYVFGYSLFIWSSLSMIPLTRATPDMCVAACVYLAAGILLRIRNGSTTWVTFAGLGTALGFGYLAKAPMFPLTFVFLGIAVFTLGSFRRAIHLGSVAFFAFVLICAPVIVGLSISKDRFSFGESARLAYVRMINRVPGRHWQGDSSSGTALNPTRKIFAAPAVYEFGHSIKGTYPPWYDPSHWYEGVTPRFDGRRQISRLVTNMDNLLSLIVRSQSTLIVAFAILFLMARRGWLLIRDLGQQWCLLVTGLAAFVMYLWVYVEPRYVASFFVLLWLGIASGLRLPESAESRKLASSVIVATATVLILIVGVSSPFRVYGAIAELVRGIDHSQHQHWQIADGLRQMGIQPGDKVAVLGQGTPGFRAYWARLARVKIVSEMPFSDVIEFVTADPALRSKVIQAFASSGASIIVGENLPSPMLREGWLRIGETNHFAYFFETSALSGDIKQHTPLRFFSSH
jgi:hypothetical protein